MHDVFCKQYGWIYISHLKNWNEQLIKKHYWAHSFMQFYDKGKNPNMI